MSSHPEVPLVSRLELASKSSSLTWARRHTRDVLKAWSIDGEVIEVAELLVSELATNAVKYSISGQPPPPYVTQERVSTFVLLLRFDGGRLFVEVYDEDRTPPQLRAVDEESESGRGLLLVERLTTRWGYTYPTPYSGKVVWCEVSLHPVEASCG